MGLSRIPMPSISGEILSTVPKDVSEIMNRIIQQRLQAQQNAETAKYHQGELGIQQGELGLRQQAENRAQKESPLNLELLKARINAENELAGQRKRGGDLGSGFGGVSIKNLWALQRSIAEDNPHLSEDQQREAMTAVAEGKDTLSDGTKINAPSFKTNSLLDIVNKSRTTSPLLTQGIRANAAEAEMPVFDKYISEGRKPYGDTVMGMSPQQIKDSLAPNNPEAAQRLGKYIASDMLAFDKAALQTRIAGTESGVTIIEDVMKRAQQTINAKYPRMSDKARQVALETIGNALTDALHARNKYGINASAATGNMKKADEPKVKSRTYNLQTGKFE